MKLISKLGLSVLSAALLAGCTKSAPENKATPTDTAVPITVAQVELTPMDRTLSVVGTLVAKDQAIVGAEVEGKVEKTMADFGDRLQAGQILASIDTDLYEVQVQQANANLAKAKATALNALQNLKRTQSLRAEKIASESDLDKDTAGSEQAAAEVKAAEAALATAQLNLKRSRVVAPFDCAVAERVANAGDYLKVGASLFNVVNDNEIKFTTEVPEAFAPALQKDQLVSLTVDGWPTNVFEGRVYLISPRITIATRSFPVAALVPNADHRLKANGFARGQIVLQQQVPTPTIPLDSVINFAGVTRTFVVANGVALSRPITVGRIKDGRQEVLSGLQPGEVVVASGQTKLQDQSKVRIKQPEMMASSTNAATNLQ